MGAGCDSFPGKFHRHLSGVPGDLNLVWIVGAAGNKNDCGSQYRQGGYFFHRVLDSSIGQTGKMAA
jgi:hypothetical protein